jgi:quinol monooxygenase YgiN
MIVIAGTVRVPPENIDKARPNIEAMVTASRAETGCTSYSYAQDLLDPGVVHVIEVWESDAALKAHFEMPHMAAWRAVWPSLEIGDRNLTRHTVLAPTPSPGARHDRVCRF